MLLFLGAKILVYFAGFIVLYFSGILFYFVVMSTKYLIYFHMLPKNINLVVKREKKKQNKDLIKT